MLDQNVKLADSLKPQEKLKFEAQKTTQQEKLTQEKPVVAAPVVKPVVNKKEDIIKKAIGTEIQEDKHRNNQSEKKQMYNNILDTDIKTLLKDRKAKTITQGEPATTIQNLQINEDNQRML